MNKYNIKNLKFNTPIIQWLYLSRPPTYMTRLTLLPFKIIWSVYIPLPCFYLYKLCNNVIVNVNIPFNININIEF